MNKSIAPILLLVAVAVNSASAFTAIQPSTARSSPLTSPRRVPLGQSLGSSPGTVGTSLNLKVKVDPEAPKKKGNK